MLGELFSDDQKDTRSENAETAKPEIKRNKFLRYFLIVFGALGALATVFYIIIILAGVTASAFLQATSRNQLNAHVALSCVSSCINSKEKNCISSCFNSANNFKDTSAAKNVNRKYTYISSGDGYEIDFPTKPTTSSSEVKFTEPRNTTLEKVVLSTDFTGDNPGIYAVVTYEYPAAVDLSDSKSLLNKTPSFDSIHSGIKLVSSSSSQFQSFYAVDYLMTDKKGDIATKSFIVGKRYYSISVISDENATNYLNEFVKSFKLINLSSTTPPVGQY